MQDYRVAVLVRPRSGVMDPQAEAVGESLTSLGYSSVAVDWVGRQLTMTITADGADSARALAEELCERLLVNPNLESFDLQVEPLGVGPG